MAIVLCFAYHFQCFLSKCVYVCRVLILGVSHDLLMVVICVFLWCGAAPVFYLIICLWFATRVCFCAFLAFLS